MPATPNPSTPPARPKSAAKSATGKSVTGAPMGTKKVQTPKKATPPKTQQVEQQVEKSTPNPKETVEEPHTPVQESNDDEVAKPDPKDLDEAIDIGDNDDNQEPENNEGGEEEDDDDEHQETQTETETNVEPSEIDHAEEGGEEAAESIEHPEENVTELGENATDLGDQAEEEVGEHADELDENGEQVGEEAGENVEGLGDKVGETTEGAEDQVGETVEGAEDKVGETAEGAEETAEGAEDKVGETAEGAEETAEGAEEKVGETAEGAEENADFIPEGGEPTVLGNEDMPEIPAELDFAILEGKKVNKSGLIVDEEGNPFGKLIEGDAKKLAGKKVDAEGRIWNDSGKIIGKAEPIPEEEREPPSQAPFEDFPDAVVDASGNIMFEGRKIGIVTEGDPKKLAGKKVDADGDILDKHGNVIGKSIREDEEEPEPEPEVEEVKIDNSALNGLKVNKAGNLVSDNGKLIGRVVEGSLKSLIGKTSDGEGNIHNEVGKVIGRAELIPENEREEQNEAPFEDFPGAIVEKTGNVTFEGKVIGRVIEGDAKKLAGKTVDSEGDIVDRHGTVVGKAERWEEEEVPEEVVDMSILAGKRVNKAGNVVDGNGTIYGRLVEGDVKQLAGKMCDKQGFVRNEAGDVVGKAELVSEGDREGLKTGPFADFPGSIVAKEGKVVYQETIVGRLIEGDPKKLFGKAVDEDGDVLDKNGNVVGKAERWEEEEKQKDVHPLSGLKVNRKGEVYNLDGELAGKLTEGELSRCAGQKIDDDGDVVDQKGDGIGHVSLLEDIPEPENVHPLAGLRVNKKGEVYSSEGDLVGKLTSGEMSRCAGQKIDNDGDVVDQKGTSIGHVSLIEDIEEPEPEVEEETEEEKAKRLEAEEDKKLAIKMAACIQSTLDSIHPILKRITELIDAAEAKKPEDVDEEKLVSEVKPLIEEGGRMLTEANGVIRGLDPDGRISERAKGNAAAREATPEEYRLADLLKELTGSVTTTIDNAKKKIEGLPHAKKELNPLWGLLSEPLFQILAAVGLLLSGVLGLVSQLLNGLGLGGLVRGLLGGLGITRVLDGLGLGKMLAPLTGGGKK